MKTDREAAEEILADEFKANLKDPSDLQLQVTLNPDVEIIIRAMLKLCKHKEESRWIPVSEKPNGSGFYYVADEYNYVHEVYYHSVMGEWFCQYDLLKKYEYTVKFYQRKLLPPPPQTNK